MFSTKRRKNKQVIRGSKGFTLIELLVVIGIIGILSSVVLASLNSSRRKADDSKRNQDMAQVKIALELYAEKNNFNYPLLSKSEEVTNKSTFSFVAPQVNRILAFSASPVYASVVHTEPACLKFDQLAELLTARGYLPTVPHDPQDSPTGTCYKAVSVDTDGDSSTAEAVAGYALLWEKYKTQTNGEFGNKKTGFIVSKSQEIDNTLAATVCTTTGEYPILDLANMSGLCTRNADGKIADKIIGVTDGVEFSSVSISSGVSSDIPSDIPSDMSSDLGSDTGSDAGSSNAYCSDSQYTDQYNCEMDRSYCSNPAYSDQSSCTTNGESFAGSCSNSAYSDEYSCTTNGSYSNGYCSDSSYTDEWSCTSNGSYSGGYCSGGGYNDQSSCESAGFGGDGYCSNSQYTDQSSCESAGYESGGYCSGGGYGDEESCINSGYSSGSDYCSDGYSSDQYSCENNGATWYTSTWYSNNYTWYPASYSSYGYTWTSGTWSSYGYTWYQGTYTANTWYSGTFTNNYWTAGSWEPYTWNSIPGNTWYP